LGGCLNLLVSLEVTEPAVKNGFFRYEGSVSLADDGISVRPCNLSAAEIPQKSSKPLYFYNRKHKVKRASKLDMGQLAGELISVAPGAVPLVGSQCSVSGGLSGLFLAFEPVGMTGSKVEGSFLASTDEAGADHGSLTVKSSAQSSPARGLLRRGFLKPRSFGGGGGGGGKLGEEDAIRRSPLPVTISEVGESSKRSDLLGDVDGKLGVVGVDGYSEVVVSTMGIAPALGISFGGNEKRFLDLLSVIEEGQHREDGVLFRNRRGGGSGKIWNALSILMLEALGLAGVKTGRVCGFRVAL
jgi:hypothetical protein